MYVLKIGVGLFFSFVFFLISRVFEFIFVEIKVYDRRCIILYVCNFVYLYIRGLVVVCVYIRWNYWLEWEESMEELVDVGVYLTYSCFLVCNRVCFLSGDFIKWLYVFLVGLLIDGGG